MGAEGEFVFGGEVTIVKAAPRRHTPREIRGRATAAETRRWLPVLGRASPL